MKHVIKQTLVVMLAVLFGLQASAQRWTPSAPADGGTYYLYNVGMRGYLVGGHSRAMLAPEPVAGQTVTLEQDGTNTNQFRIDTHNLRGNGGTDQWLVDNTTDDRWVYIDVAKNNAMHMPWTFTEVEGKENVYWLVVTGGTDDGRRLEMDSRNNGVPDLNNRASVNMYTRTTRQSSAGGNLVGENDQWMLVTPADYEASKAGTTDFTAKVGTAQSDWTGTMETGTAVMVTTADGRTTGIPAFYGSAAVGTKISQTVTGLDNGIYEVRVFAHSHNERQDHGTAAPGSSVTGMPQVTYVFAESGESHVETWINARGRDPLGWTLAEHHTPYTISDVMVKNGQITIGLALAQANQTQWQAMQIYSLVRTGDLPLTEKIEAYESALADAVSDAANTGLPTGFRAALQAVIDANSGANAPSTTDGDALDAAAAALISATKTAETSRAPYARYLADRAKAIAVDDDTEAYTGSARADVSAADEAIDTATSTDEIDAATQLLYAAVKTFVANVSVVKGKSLDLTILMTNPDFTDGTTGWQWKNGVEPTVDATYHDCEYYEKDYDIYQVIDDMPIGTYQLKVQAFQRPGEIGNVWTAYQAAGSNITAQLYVNSTTATIKNIVEEQHESRLFDNGTWQNDIHLNGGNYVPNSMGGARAYFDAGYYDNEVAASVTDGTLTLGFKSASHVAQDWTIFDNFRLYYTGVDYSGYEEQLASAVESAKTTATSLDGLVPTAVVDGLNATETDFVAADIETAGNFNAVIAGFDAAVSSINERITGAQSTVAPYARFKYIAEAKDVITAQTDVYTDADGTHQDALTAALTTATAAAEGAVTAEDIDAQTEALYAAYATFVKATNIAGSYFDLTSLIVNPGFETSRTEGYSYSHDGGAFNWMTVGDEHCVEFFNCTYDLSQTLTSMPAGTYRVQVNGHYRPNNENAPAEQLQENVDGYLYLTGGTPVQLQVLRDNLTSIPDIHTLMDAGEYSNEAFAVVDGDGLVNVTFGIKCDTQRRLYSWTLIDDFRLLYTTDDTELFLAPYNEALAAAKAIDTTQPMNSAEREALVNAIGADATIDKGNIATLQDATTVLTEAATTAQTSILSYAEAKAALDRIATEMDATNLVTAAARATFMAYGEAYDAGILTDDEASGLMRRTFRDGVNRSPGNTIDEYLLSAWSEGDTEMRDYDGDLYINTWSVEDDVEGFTYPFYEVADGYNASTIAHTFTATVDGIEPGDYKVELWARTRIKLNGENNYDAYPEDITFQLNDGTPVRLEGELTGRFRNGHYTIYGTVADDGILTLTLNIPAAEQGTWLSFKDVKYTKIDVQNVTLDEDVDYMAQAGVANVTLNRTFNPDAWNTLTLPFSISDVTAVFGDDAKVAVYEGSTTDGQYTTLNFRQTDRIPANQPVFITGVGTGGTYTIRYAEIEEATPVVDDDAVQFIGTYSTMTLDPATYFVGADNKLYKTGTNGTVTLKGTRAYFAPTATGVKALRLNFGDDGDATAISSITPTLSEGEGAVFDLSGRAISHPAKGLYIIDGKKVLIKE